MTPNFRIALASTLSFTVIACSPDVDQPQAEDGADTIECALGGSEDFAADCMVERSETDGQIILTVRHADGGFRRFEQLDDGRGLAELDGADVVSRNLEDGILLIEVAGDKYRFDANVRAADEAAE